MPRTGDGEQDYQTKEARAEPCFRCAVQPGAQHHPSCPEATREPEHPLTVRLRRTGNQPNLSWDVWDAADPSRLVVAAVPRDLFEAARPGGPEAIRVLILDTLGEAVQRLMRST